MKLLIALSSAVWVVALPRGPFPVTIPIEGVTDANAGDLRRTLEKGFADLKFDDGNPVVIEIGTIERGAVTLTLDCPGGLHLSHIRKALEGSSFSLRPDRWELYGKVGFAWKSRSDPPGDLGEALASFGKCELDRVDGGWHAHLLFDRDKPARSAGILKALADRGVKDPDIVWENYPHMHAWGRMDCGARRIPEEKSAAR